jgi:hypothetical protein
MKMTKTTKRVFTQGIEHVAQAFDVTPIFKLATKLHTDEQYFLSLKPFNGKTLVTDGNRNTLATLDIEIPEPMYCIRDDYDDYYVTTLMLTYEY